MRDDSSTVPPHLAALFAQMATTEARIGQLDRELAAIRAGRWRDLAPPRRSVPDVAEARDAVDTAADVMPWTSGPETPPLAMEAAVARSKPQRGLRPLRQPSRPAKKRHHSHHRGH